MDSKIKKMEKNDTVNDEKQDKPKDNKHILHINKEPINNKLVLPLNLTLSEVFVNLTLIAKIELGDKIYHNGKFINIDTRYFAFFYRWMSNIDRNDTIIFINVILNQAFDYNKKLIQDNKEGTNNLLLFRLTSDLKNSMNGLNNLKHTYSNDKLILSEIDVIMDNIRTIIDANSKNFKFI